jgi:hypothetical protein
MFSPFPTFTKSGLKVLTLLSGAKYAVRPSIAEGGGAAEQNMKLSS